MGVKRVLSISEARKKIFEIAEETQKPGVYYILTENGRPKAVMISVYEFDSWQETLEAMRDFPDLKKDVVKINNDIKSGEYNKYSNLEKIMIKNNFILSDVGRKRYGVEI